MAQKVVVVGAGPLGLMAMKNFKEDGFDVTGFESRSYVGGLWKDSSDSTISVHATTRFNSSKFRSAISDFPFPEEADDFPTATQLFDYLKSYSDHFGLTPIIQLSTKVVGLERVGEKWALEVQTADAPARTEFFDKICIATGSFFQPKKPKFDGIEQFKGDILHSIDYHGPKSFANKRILMIGIHATAQDIAASLEGTADKIYMSHRRGLILLPRHMPDGTSFDTTAGMRMFLAMSFLTNWVPRLFWWLLQQALISTSKKSFPVKPEWRFFPASSMAVSTPLIGDKLYEMLTSGFATSVNEVKRITGPRSIQFIDGTEIHDIDAILYCTGYDFAIPFIPKSSPYQPYPVPSDPPHLYRNIFPLHPDPKIRNSLAFLGQVAIAFPGFVLFETVSQAVSQIWRGRSSLPPLEQMQKWHRDNIAWRARQMAIYGPSSTFYTAFVPFSDHIHWADRTAGTGIFAHFDWAWFNWRSWRLWWRDPELYRICMNGVFSPAIWRLFDCGGRKAWDGARDQVFWDNEAVARAKERRYKEMQLEKERKVNENGTLEFKKEM